MGRWHPFFSTQFLKEHSKVSFQEFSQFVFNPSKWNFFMIFLVFSQNVMHEKYYNPAIIPCHCLIHSKSILKWWLTSRCMNFKRIVSILDLVYWYFLSEDFGLKWTNVIKKPMSLCWRRLNSINTPRCRYCRLDILMVLSICFKFISKRH